MGDTRTITVEGMSCTGCEDAVEDALTGLAGVESAAADNEAGTVEIVGDPDDDAVRAAVDEAGYEVVG